MPKDRKDTLRAARKIAYYVFVWAFWSGFAAAALGFFLSEGEETFMNTVVWPSSGVVAVCMAVLTGFVWTMRYRKTGEISRLTPLDITAPFGPNY